MLPVRRRSGIHDRRQWPGISPQPGVLSNANEQNTTSNAAPALTIGDAVSSREESVRVREQLVQSREVSNQLQENANLEREEKVRLREDAAQQRETTAMVREQSATSRDEETHNERTANAARQDQNVKLRQANEHLVITSLRSQVIADELKISKAAMTHLAHHDFLTDLPNRMQLDDRIALAIALAKRHSEKLAVLFLDLDRFKIVNDTLGHAVGDQLLQSVALRLKSAIRSSDTVSRQGGDEFLLLLSEVSQEETLVLKIEEIHSIITAPYYVAGNNLEIGATIGISMYPENGMDAETLIRNADSAMYFAKENGRNHYQFFNQEMRARDEEREGLETGLHLALEQHQFVLFYQAQVNLGSGAITGAEALIRWRHPRKGLLRSAWFLPVAEECGAMVPIGRWVLREACRQAQAWLDADLDFNVIAVNISAREFEHEDFLENVRAVLQETGLAPDRLELELSETVLMKSIERTGATLDALRATGVRIAIDGFGIGCSSLSHLKRPVDTMKIDQSFVHDISTDDDDYLVNAVIGIGKILRRQVIAEGVETAQQLAFLRENHCPAVQGFYLNAPMMAEEFATVLKQGIASCP